MKKIICLIMAMALCQGCAAAAIMYGAHEISKAKMESAEKQERSSDLATYTTYRVQMERVNLDREKAGLKPNPIMSQEEWIGAQTAGRPAIAPAKE